MDLRTIKYLLALIFLFLSGVSAASHLVDKQHTKIHDLFIQLADKLDINTKALDNPKVCINSMLEKHYGKLIDYIPKRVDEVYALELDYFGSGHSQLMGDTRTLVVDWIINELTFLQTQQLTNERIQNWLGDGKDALWPHIQKLTTPQEILKKTEETIDVYISKNIKDSALCMNDSNFYSLSSNYTLAKTKQFSLKLQRKKYTFSDVFIKRIRLLDLLINRAFFQALALCESQQIGMEALLAGQESWLTLRGDLMNLYELGGVTEKIAALRLICLSIDRLYYYQKFVKYFREKDSYRMCLQPPPYFYGTMLDCDAVVITYNLKKS